MKRSLLFTIAVLFGISGCGQQSAHTIVGKNDVMFYGESDSWAVHYGWDYIDGNKQKSQLILQYKGSNAKSVGDVNFITEGKNFSLGGTRTLPENGFIDFAGGISSPADPLPAESDIVKATITWGHTVEKIDLTQKKK